MLSGSRSDDRTELFLLPPRLARQLTLFCDATGDDPADVIADALALHFDALEGDAALGDLAAEAAHAAPS